MSEVKKCPKCKGEMIHGEFLKNLPKIAVFSKKGQRSLYKAIPTCCKKCGFVEIYKYMRDSWKPIPSPKLPSPPPFWLVGKSIHTHANVDLHKS